MAGSGQLTAGPSLVSRESGLVYVFGQLSLAEYAAGGNACDLLDCAWIEVAVTATKMTLADRRMKYMIVLRGSELLIPGNVVFLALRWQPRRRALGIGSISPRKEMKSGAVNSWSRNIA